MTVLGAYFLTGSILTLVLPVGLVVAIGVYWWALLRRRSPGTRSERTR